MSPIDDNVDRILLRLSLEEKVSLLTTENLWRTASIRGSGKVFVPQTKTTGAPHGVQEERYNGGVKSALFSCAACIGASFDRSLAFQVGKEIAKEALSRPANMLLAPTVNLDLSPLGSGRHERFSEDPYLSGVIGAAFINGCQSVGVGAAPKYLMTAGGEENRRRVLNGNMTERTLREISMYPFQLILRMSDPWCLTTRWINGTYVTEDSRLLRTILRDEWGYQGMVMSDWNRTQSTVLGMNAGVDLEMSGPAKNRAAEILQAVKDKLVTEDTVSESAKRVLELVKKCKRLDDSLEQHEEHSNNPGRDDFLVRSTSEGAVLLRNENDILPLKPHDSSLKIAVIGYYASVPPLSDHNSLRSDFAPAVSPLNGLASAGVKFTYERGVPVFAAIPSPSPSTLSKTRISPPDTELPFHESLGSGKSSSNSGSTTVKPVKLEFFNGSVIGVNKIHERSVDKTEYMLQGEWPSYLDENYCSRMTFDLTPTTTGPHTISVITTGTAILYIDGERVFTRGQEQQLHQEAFYFFRPMLERRFTRKMEAGRTYTFKLESWAATPEALAKSFGGSLTQGSGVGFFEHVDIPRQISSAAIAARESDIAIVFTGTTADFESEGYDRDTLKLTAEQYQLVNAVAAAKPKRGTIVINYSGAPVNLFPFTSGPNAVQAIIQAWLPGQACGNSIAALLTGAINPSGRLPMSWPRKIEDNPSYNSFSAVNSAISHEEGVFIGYRYYDIAGVPKPLFPFGFGLSYTSFAIRETGIVGSFVMHGVDGKVRVHCDVVNTGNCAGKSVVQFYVQSPTPPGFVDSLSFDRRNMDSNIARPLKEFKAFEKVPLQPGERRLVRVEFDGYAVSFYDEEKSCWRAVKGSYKVLVGFSAEEIAGETTFIVDEDFTWNGI